jgi:hypothetical protein
MSHAIDLEGLYEKLFLLQHIAHGSLSHCRSAKVVLEDPDFDPEFDPNFKTIWSLTKTLVSNYLIECAVKLRMIQEFCAKHFEADDLNMLEERAMTDLLIGRIVQGTFRLTIREASNKIIHATSATVDFAPSATEAPPVLYWHGLCNLRGHHGRAPWHLELDVAQWARAVIRYLEFLADEEKLCYLGQDYA